MRIQCQYNILEDRLLLVVSTAPEAQGWWVTRRAAGMLLQVMIDQMMILAGNGIDAMYHDLIYAFKQEEVAGKIPIMNEPLAEMIDQDLLVSIRYGLNDAGLSVIVLVGNSGKEQALEVDADSLVSLVGLLRSQIDRTDWELSIKWPEDGQIDDRLGPNVQ